MNILVLEAWASSLAGGAENSMRAYLEEISGSNKIHLACSKMGDYANDPEMRLLYESIETLQLSNISVSTAFASMIDLVRLVLFVRKKRIDKIVTHLVHVSPLLRAVKALTGCPYSIYFKWVLSKPHAGKKVSWGNAAVDRAAAISEFVKDWWVQNGIPANKIVVVPEGIIVGERGLKTRRTAFEIGFAGRLVPEKGLLDAISALAIIRRKFPDVVLRVAGRFPGSPEGKSHELEVNARITELQIADAVFFDGFINPLHEWLAERDVVLIPSTCEDAQNLVMMQSMGVGTPVVATKVGGIPEVLSEDLAVLTVPRSNPAALASRTIQLLADPMQSDEIGDKLRQRCVNRYGRTRHIADLNSALGLSDTRGP